MRTALKPDEIILIIIRQHWIKLVLPFGAWLLAVVLLNWLAGSTGFLIGMTAILYPLYEYLNWRSNLWCVTNLRVVDETGFFSRYSKESPLDKINNVEYDQSIWGRIFGYGNVDIQTAAELGATTYHLIHRPKLLKDTITHAQESYKHAQMNRQAQQLAEAITSRTVQQPATTSTADEVEKLFRLLQQGALTQEEFEAAKKRVMERGG